MWRNENIPQNSLKVEQQIMISAWSSKKQRRQATCKSILRHHLQKALNCSGHHSITIITCQVGATLLLHLHCEAHRPKIDPHQFQPPSPLWANFTAAASSVISRTSIVPKSSHHTLSSSAKDTHPLLVYLGQLHHRCRFQAKPVLSSSPNRRAHSLLLRLCCTPPCHIGSGFETRSTSAANFNGLNLYLWSREHVVHTLDRSDSPTIETGSGFGFPSPTFLPVAIISIPTLLLQSSLSISYWIFEN